MIAYYSLTGNVHRFVHKLGRPASLYTIKSGGLGIMTEPYVLITPTTGFGQVPATVAEFVANNSDMLAGVVASGQRNWGDNFAAAGRIISEQYGVPLLYTFELSGTDTDVTEVNRLINEMETII